MQSPIDQKSLEAGVYSFRDLQSLGFVKDRTDLLRKQRRYKFPAPVKFGDRQAAFLRQEVLAWVRDRVAERLPKAELPEGEAEAVA